jgi:hypothetical protein
MAAQPVKDSTSPVNTAPNFGIVWIYFSQKGKAEEDAKAFFAHYKKTKWKSKRGKPVRNWKAAANNWIWEHRKKAPFTIAEKLCGKTPPK